MTSLARTWEEIERVSGQGVGAVVAAHKLKSSSRSVGAARVGEVCQQLESAGKAGDTKAIAPLMRQALAMRPVFETAIRTFLNDSE